MDLLKKIPEVYTELRDKIVQHDLSAYTQYREEALSDFLNMGFPNPSDEQWKDTDVRPFLQRNFNFDQKPIPKPDYDRVFSCDIPAFNAHIVALYNGIYVAKENNHFVFDDGTIVSSLSYAMDHYPEIIEQYLNKISNEMKSAFNALNTAFAHEGLFIYVPDNVNASKTIQLVNTMNGEGNNFIQTRNLIVLGKNSSLKFIHCDDSNNDMAGFSNLVNEIYIDENASLDYYRYQNVNNLSALINSSFFNLKKDSRLLHNTFSLNGGLIRNNYEVKLNGEHGHAQVYGLYLMDRDQHIDNQIKVDHLVPHCTSKEWFKGILDDHASGVFNGHVLVARDAQKTEAYQTNNNILLTDKATVNSNPFLEIYADDVRCSHGSTTGQLNDDVMFYLRSRGINEKDAKLLQMFAFTADIIDIVELNPLRERTEDLVKKRLRGELDNCEHCVLQCKSPEKKFSEFEVV